MKAQTLVEVVWEDSCSNGRWQDRAVVPEWHNDPAICTTVGYILHDDKKGMTVCQSQSKDQVDGLFKIPKNAIRKVRRLK